MTVFPERSMKPKLAVDVDIDWVQTAFVRLYLPGGLFIHQYPTAATTTTAVTIAMRAREIGRAVIGPRPPATGGAAGAPAALGTAPTGTSPEPPCNCRKTWRQQRSQIRICIA